ncbi:MAG TPA: hypothetical protein VH325_11595 [Bryobacteraceae bacterium]|jgi:hypothetical protein|nr:hypothetical protein [Bryobacteraceae bacterium]
MFPGKRAPFRARLSAAGVGVFLLFSGGLAFRLQSQTVNLAREYIRLNGRLIAIENPSVTLVNNTHPSANFLNSANFETGDNFTISVSGASPNTAVYVSLNGGSRSQVATTDVSGAWSGTGNETTTGTYSEVWYVGNNEVGVLTFFVISTPTVTLTNTTNPQMSPNFHVGNSFSLTISAGATAGNQVVGVTVNGGSLSNLWSTNTGGTLVLTGVENTAGSYSEQWYVAGLPASVLNFTVTNP